MHVKLHYDVHVYTLHCEVKIVVVIHVGRFLSFFFFERRGGLETAVDYQGTLHFDISWEHRNQKKTKKEKRD